MPGLPSVAIVIANWNGVAHLPACLESMAKLDYPHDLLEIIVVDNGSTDDSLQLLEHRYPWVRVVAQDRNLGFAAASNAGAEAATAECIAFLNNDMHVDRRWLAELVASYDPAAGYVCVASVILNWEGTHIDFVDGRINFHGAPNAEYLDEPVDEGLIEDGRDLPFACGGAMLIARDVFLDLRGFDPDYFAYCEDVDLGWRLWVTGYKVRLAARSRAFHRRHGTGSSIPLYKRILLFERNNLMSLIKNVSDENFAPLLTAALFLLVDRSVMLGGSDRGAFDIGSSDVDENEVVRKMGLAGLHGTSDVLANLDALLAKRQEVQRRRKRSDAEVFDLFRRPFVPVVRSERYLQSSVELRAILGLDRLFRRQRASRILVVADSDSPRLRGLAQHASALTEVVFASAARAPTLPNVSVTPIRGRGYLEQLLVEADVVFVEGRSEYGRVIAEHAPGVVAVDLAERAEPVDPALLERADVLMYASENDRRRLAPGGGAAEVVVPDDAALVAKLRSIVAEPWHWRRAGETDSVTLPEDLRLLLAKRRSSAGSNGVVRSARRAAWSRLPEPLQRLALRILRLAR